MRPSVGRIVHYTSLGSADGKFPPEVQAALITSAVPKRENHLHDDEDEYDVYLRVFYGNDRGSGDFAMAKVPFFVEPQPGHWNWPPRT